MVQLTAFFTTKGEAKKFFLAFPSKPRKRHFKINGFGYCNMYVAASTGGFTYSLLWDNTHEMKALADDALVRVSFVAISNNSFAIRVKRHNERGKGISLARATEEQVPLTVVKTNTCIRWFWPRRDRPQDGRIEIPFAHLSENFLPVLDRKEYFFDFVTTPNGSNAEPESRAAYLKDKKERQAFREKARAGYNSSSGKPAFKWEEE